MGLVMWVRLDGESDLVQINLQLLLPSLLQGHGSFHLLPKQSAPTRVARFTSVLDVEVLHERNPNVSAPLGAFRVVDHDETFDLFVREEDILFED